MANTHPAGDLPVVILCGGQGTRIREASERLPKPLIEIGEYPILWHIMKVYRHHGFRRFILCLGYKGWDIKQFFLRYREHQADFTIDLAAGGDVHFHSEQGQEDWQVTCVETGLHTGTGARLSRVRHLIDSDNFLFTYGDGLGDVDLTSLVDFHLDHGQIGTVTGVHPTSRFGEMRSEGRLALEFNEKPTRPEGFVSGGFFAFRRQFFDYLADDADVFLEKEPLQKLARDGQLMIFPHEGFWMGMDTYRDYLELNSLWEDGTAPWQVWR